MNYEHPIPSLASDENDSTAQWYSLRCMFTQVYWYFSSRNVKNLDISIFQEGGHLSTTNFSPEPTGKFTKFSFTHH